MDCFMDFCLCCDRDSPDGPYCSQKCKLADLERAYQSYPSSPTTSTTSRSWSTSPGNMSRQKSVQTHDGSAAHTSTRPSSSYFMWTPSYQTPEHGERQLTPSSSRSSLSSTSSGSSIISSPGISTEAKQTLQEYFASFDQAKASKRRWGSR